jgi:hypothetical protein
MTEEPNHIELLDLEIDSIVNFIIGLTSTKAYQYLGIPIKQGNKPVKDLEKARLAIDITIFLVEKIEPYIDEEQNKQLIQIISNLQFTFLRESQ